MNATERYQSELERTRQLVKAPDWYLEFGKVRKAKLLGLGALQAAFRGNISQAAATARLRMFDDFEQLLQADEVRIGRPGVDELDDHDSYREPIDTVVIHHASRAEGISLPALNALQFLSTYVPRYQEKGNPILNSQGQHQPIYSGHFNENGRQVFYLYHWKVAQDGTVQRLLPDKALLWHAGDWAINKRSVSICIDDDLLFKAPTPESLQAVAGIINTNYAGMNVIGHSEASATTICPGNRFMKGWKLELLARLQEPVAE